MSATSYYRIQVRRLARENEDTFAQFCLEHGAAGVAEQLDFEQPELKYEPEVKLAEQCTIDVFFERPPAEDLLLRLKSEFPEVDVAAFVEAAQDWMSEWKKGFKPFLFVSPFWIVPSWSEPPPQAKEILRIDPGMAFGTGTHDTTRLAAELLVEELRSRPLAGAPGSSARPPSLIDVGTGTGLLAMVGARLGASPVVGIDNDPEARRVARENLALNAGLNVGLHIEIQDRLVEQIDQQFNVVVANIIDGVLLDLKPELLRIMQPGGRMILSGILSERSKNFQDQFVFGSGLQVLKEVSHDEWTALLLG